MLKPSSFASNLTLLIKLASRAYQGNKTSGSYHKYVKHAAQETINKSLILNDGTIPHRVYSKIQWYMVEAVFMGELLANLLDYSMSKKEKESFIYLGAVMSLFDVIIDDFKLDKKVVAAFVEYAISKNKKAVLSNETSIEKVLQLYINKLFEMIKKERLPEFYKHLDKIRYQIQSDNQLKENITEESVFNITIGKGGISILLCSALLVSGDDKFNKAMYELGGFIQMMNDCQDIYKDTKEGITTFVHFRKSFREIYNKLDEQRKVTFNALNALSCSYRGRSETVFCFNTIFIAASHKLQMYAKACSYSLNFNSIALMDKKYFTINPYSPRAHVACVGKILRFDNNNIYKPLNFKFEV